MKLRRRTFLKGAGSLVAASAAGRLAFAKANSPAIGIIGGGIIGASIAMHLADAGARVTLFERSAPAAGATGKSFAWINAYNSDPHYRELRLKSIAGWDALDKRLPLDVHWGGCVHWAENIAEAERLKAEMDEFDSTGYPATMIGPDELAEIAPNLDLGPANAVAFNSLDAHIDPIHVTKLFLQQAETLGARVIHPCEVTELTISGGQLKGVATTRGEFALDRVVVACGVDTPLLAEQAGYSPPLKHAPGILLHTGPVKPLLEVVLESPHMYFKQYRDGRIIGNDASYAPKIPAHEGILAGPQEMPDAIRSLHGERILNQLREKLPAAIDARFDHLTLGYRPMPADGMPIVGFSPACADVYIAVMHSGVTLAPIIGRHVSQELVSDDSVDELAPYRPDRYVGQPGVS